MKHFILFFLLYIPTLFAEKPLIDFCKTGMGFVDASISSMERPDYILCYQGKNSNVIVLTEVSMTKYQEYRDLGYEYIVAYLIEPKALHEFRHESDHAINLYDFVEENINQFDVVLTFDKYLLDTYPEKCKFIHAPGYATLYNKGIHHKSKLCSHMTSKHNFIYGQLLRIAISTVYLDYFDACKGPNDPWTLTKDEWVNDFCFTVVVENSKQAHYFSEKLIESFQSGTIPIYWGCPTISDFFDMDGIITFDTIEDLEPILQSLSFQEYEKRFAAVQNNYEIAKKYPEHYFTTMNHHPGPFWHNHVDRPDAVDAIWPHLKHFFDEE